MAGKILHDGIGIEGRAIVELDTLAQLERPDDAGIVA
ncbi:hypothetical protein FHX08_004946 [Rhizobium sp. BK529]|nr:hypothetical protein [Rhizobium sp. BK529]